MIMGGRDVGGWANVEDAGGDGVGLTERDVGFYVREDFCFVGHGNIKMDKISMKAEGGGSMLMVLEDH